MGEIRLVDKQTGADTYVDEADLPAALASQKYIDPSSVAVSRAGENTMVAPDVLRRESASGVTQALDPAQLALERGHQIRQDANTGIVAQGKALLGGAVSGLTFGLASPFQEAQEFNPKTAFVGEVGGAFAPGLVGEAGGLLRGAELARDPVAAEHAAEAISSSALYGGKAAKGASGLETELVRAKRTLGDAADVSDLAGLDAKGLRAAEKAEIAGIKAARVPEAQKLVEDLGSFRRALKEDDKIFLATKGIKEAQLPEGAEGLLKVQEIGKTSLDADRQLDRLLRNPKALAERPQRALDVLQQQETALEHLQKRESTLRDMFAADTSGDRVAALDAVPGAIERNRALQGRIRALVAEPSSARLDAIASARDALGAGAAAGGKSLPEQMLGGAVFSTVSAAAHAMPGGSIVAHLLGAKASQFATDAVFGRLAGMAEKGKAAAGQALDRIVSVAKASPAAPVLATKVLAQARFAAPERGARSSTDLAENFHRVSREIRSQTAFNAAGAPEMRPDARAQMAQLFKPIALVNPQLADQLETLGARRIEFLASKLPRMPDVFGMPAGPSTWQPSDLEMRTYARYVEAAHNPKGVEERLAAGAITPEDVEAYKAVYPQRYQAMQQGILQKLPTLRQTLPYQRKLALSIFTGIAVDPALDPRILRVLQGQFPAEPGSEMGTQAPTPKPAFGSVRADIGTPSEQREARMR